jgi:DNA-binding PadR family transcriptional regulator
MDPKTFLPLTETSLLILLSLATKPKHGYAILKDIELLTNDRVKMATGTLYSAIRRMLEDGWIERLEDDATKDTGRIRKLYRLSRHGQRILEAELLRMNKLVEAAQSHAQWVPE